METYEVQDGARREVHGYTPDEMSTGERTGAAKLKWVVIVDRSLTRRAPPRLLASGSALGGLLDPRR